MEPTILVGSYPIGPTTCSPNPFEPTTQANSESGNDIWLCRAVIVLDGENAGAGSV
jgi:hypothetical protein